jgi:hypothetical protein
LRILEDKYYTQSNKSETTSISDDTNNNNNNKPTRKDPIIIRSQTQDIDSSSIYPNKKDSIIIELPRKDKQYYKEFRPIINNIHPSAIDIINLIKDSDPNKEPSSYKEAISSPVSPN